MTTLEDFESDDPIAWCPGCGNFSILKALKHTGWQKKRASEILGINASTLYRKLQAYKGQGLLPKDTPTTDDGDELLSEAA